MKCDECNGLVTTEKNAVRRYDIGGLPHVELHGVEVTTCKACGREDIAIPRIGQLHRVIAELLVKQQRALAPVELRFLRKHVGLSAVDFAKMMGVARETVSRWETGTQPMGSVADRLARLIVITHEPADCYAVEDLLRDLANAPDVDPSNPSGVEVWNTAKDGWRPERRKLARA